MTNEQKIQEIASYIKPKGEISFALKDGVEYGAMQMAEWKDRQLKLTPDDLDMLFNMILKERNKYTHQKGCYQEIIDKFYRLKDLNNNP